MTLAELKAELNTDFCLQTLCNALHAMKLTLKKNAHPTNAYLALCSANSFSSKNSRLR